MIAPVAKKRGAIKVKDHREVTLLSTAYKCMHGVGEQIKERDGRKRVGARKPSRFPEREI